MGICPVCGTEIADENKCDVCGVIFGIAEEKELNKIQKPSAVRKFFLRLARTGIISKIGIIVIFIGIMLCVVFTIKFIIENPDLFLP